MRVPSRAVAWGSAEDTAQLGPPTEAPKARAGTVSEESEPTRPVMGTAIVVPANPSTRRARSAYPTGWTLRRRLLDDEAGASSSASGSVSEDEAEAGGSSTVFFAAGGGGGGVTVSLPTGIAAVIGFSWASSPFSERAARSCDRFGSGHSVSLTLSPLSVFVTKF